MENSPFIKENLISMSHIQNLPLYKGGFEFLKSLPPTQKKGSSEFSHKKGGVSKIKAMALGGVILFFAHLHHLYQYYMWFIRKICLFECNQQIYDFYM